MAPAPVTELAVVPAPAPEATDVGADEAVRVPRQRGRLRLRHGVAQRAHVLLQDLAARRRRGHAHLDLAVGRIEVTRLEDGLGILLLKVLWVAYQARQVCRHGAVRRERHGAVRRARRGASWKRRRRLLSFIS